MRKLIPLYELQKAKLRNPQTGGDPNTQPAQKHPASSRPTSQPAPTRKVTTDPAPSKGNAREAQDETGEAPQQRKGRFGRHRFRHYARYERDNQVVAVFEMQTHEKAIPVSIPLADFEQHKAIDKKIVGLGIIDPIGTTKWVKTFAHPDRPAIAIATIGKWRGRVLTNAFGSFGKQSLLGSFIFDPTSIHYRPHEAAGEQGYFLKRGGRYLRQSSALALCYCLPLLAALASRIGLEGGFVVALSGDSSLGKTSAQRLALALTTRPLVSRLISVNQSEALGDAVLSAFGGAMAAFADLKTASLTDKDLVARLRTFVFAIADASQRMTMHTVERRDASYLIALMSFETAMAEFFHKNGVEFQDGDACRVIDIALKKPNGIFDRLDDGESGEAAVGALKKMIDAHHGHVLPAWAAHIASESVEELRATFEANKAEFVSKCHAIDNVERRICETFAQIFAAGAMAIDAGLLPLEFKELGQRIKKLYAANVAGRQQRQDHEQEVKQRVRDALLPSPPLPKLQLGDPLASNAVAFNQGFRRDDNGCAYLYARLDHLKKVAADDVLLTKEILRLMEKDGVLIAPSNDFTAPVLQGGSRRRYIRFDLAKLKAFYGRMA